MARQKTDIRISLKGTHGSARINLALDVFGERWHVYRDGALSRTLPLGSSTEVAKLIQRWLIGQAKSVVESRRSPRPIRIDKPTVG